MDFTELAGNVQDFLSERKKGVLISCILIIFFCAALIVLAFVPEKKSALPQYTSTPFVADDELLLPQGPSVPHSYTVTRQKQEKWDSAQIEKWLTVPDASAVEKLSAANDKMISDVIGAAP